MRQRSVLKKLREAGVPDPEGDLRRLHAWAFAGVPEDEREWAQERWDAFDAAIARRIRREPVSHILGRRAFWKHDFIVTADVLDPRPDTETLVEAALSAPFARVLDLGTGSGCILLSLLAERPDATGMGTDLSQAALAVAARNAGVAGVGARAAFRQSDWFGGVGGTFDLIVSNPPYIAADEMAYLSPEVRDWDPRLALTPGGDGLAAYCVIAKDAPAYLSAGGRLMVEVGPSQADAVSALFAQAGLGDIAAIRDIDGRERVIRGEKTRAI